MPRPQCWYFRLISSTTRDGVYVVIGESVLTKYGRVKELGKPQSQAKKATENDHDSIGVWVIERKLHM